MKKLIFYIFLVIMLFSLNYKVIANNNEERFIKGEIDWVEKNYNPILYLQPYFDFTRMDFFKSAINANVIFSDDFEGTAVQWTFVNAANNVWYIGAAVNNGGTKSLYISDDNGVTNNYSGTNAVSHAVSIPIDIDTGAKEYSLTFDWRARGEGVSFLWDYLGVWIVPSTFTPTVGTKITATNSGGILVVEKLNLQDTFTRSNFIADISSFSGQKVKIVFQWANDSSGFYQPPAAVDNIEFVKINCAAPTAPTAANISESSTTINWTAPSGVAAPTFELYISEKNSVPTSNEVGVLVSNSTTYNLTNLNPSTSYFVWIRTICSSIEKGYWVGPVNFITACGVLQTPFSEVFSSNSPTLPCWTIVDANSDVISSIGSNIWKTSGTNFVGGNSMYFYGSNSNASQLPHNDWLISPAIKFSSGKKYRLRYHYRTSSSTTHEYKFEVLMSTTGSDSLTKFTHSIVPEKNYDAFINWKEEYILFDGVNAAVNLAWHVTASTQYTYLYIDNIRIEEVYGCAEPMDLGVKNIDSGSVTIFWEDHFDADTWEYYVQKTGEKIPTATTVGIATNSNEVSITKDAMGNDFEGNTTYQYYVRTVCGNGEFSIWQGPFSFTTLCNAYTIPFVEGFNTGSATRDCWTLLNNKTNTWSFSTVNYEGANSISLNGSAANAPHDDWFISPKLEVDPQKIYRLSYFYRSTSTTNNTFEVLLSDQGIESVDFKTTLASRAHSSVNWQEDVLFFSGYQGTVNIAWRVNTLTSTSSMYFDYIRIDEVLCVEPSSLDVKDITPDEATLFWEDQFNSDWEYNIVNKDDPSPTGAGISISTNEITVNSTNSGDAIQANTEYDFYVRSKCSNGEFSEWIGPFSFKTACKAVGLPYMESFESNSLIKSCWTVTDVNADGTSTTNRWSEHSSAFYAHDGSVSMRFYGSGTGKIHDDWLISPAITMNATDIYELTYYYSTNSNYNNEFEVLLSTNGKEVSEFKQILVPKEVYKKGSYEKKTVYITNVTGESFIGWHVTSTGITYVYLDLVTIKKVDCVSPQDIILIDTATNSADFEWKDDYNEDWEYYVQPAGGSSPVGSGSLSKTRNITLTRTSGTGAANLQPNTEYEFYVRSGCGTGKNSQWEGPFYFKTRCIAFLLPFWEGFNKNSSSLECWTIIDANADVNSTMANIWRMTSTSFEGDQSAWFYGASSVSLPHDDWLITPTFTIDSNKIYRLKYHYRTTSVLSYDYEFAVLLSTAGTDPSKFTNTLVARKKFDPSTVWQEETAFINGIGGDVNIGWHVTSTTQHTNIYIDNVFLEEVTCPEPLHLGSKDEKEYSATIFWEDKFGSDWEYVVQKSGGNPPVVNGVATKTREVVVTVDKNGTAIDQNTDYEFYVRSICGLQDISDWSGPFKFRTICGVFNVPFWEGFNSNSETLICATILDENNDATSSTSNGIWRTSILRYEGTNSKYFFGTAANAPHDDWLILPKIRFESGKTYRLKYHYRGFASTTNIDEYEVVLSTSGIAPSSFTHTIIPKQIHIGSTQWKEEYVFIEGVSGDVNIAWHITSPSTATYLYIDNVFVEEVTGCREVFPSTVGFKEVGSNQVTVFWDDQTGASSWEYYIQPEGGKIPTGTGVLTTDQENVVTTAATGTGLISNTNYEFYVRTVCGNGEFSIWQGPFKFTTLCGVYTTPYWEGFDTKANTFICWSIIDANADAAYSTDDNIWKSSTTAAGIYVADRSMYFFGTGTNKTHDDWLVSPKITLDGGMYVLKYHYRASANYNNKFEVMLATDGVDPQDFTTEIVAPRVYKNANFMEEVAFIDGINGDVNLAWHVSSLGFTSLFVDNIYLKKVNNCQEPYYVKVNNETATTIDVDWTQDGGITEWELIVVNYGEDETAIPIKTVIVTGDPKTTVNGLDSGRAYTIFVRAKCSDGLTSSDWSTGIDSATQVGANNSCSGSVNIPVNKGMDCEKMASGSFIGAVNSTVEPTCSSSTLNKDIWFEFTATTDTHLLKMEDWVSLTGASLSTVYGSIYDVPCASISTTAVQCFTLSSTTRVSLFKNLTVGQKYYLRLGITTAASKEIFNLCLTSPSYLEVDPSGSKFTMEELVKDVLINSNCDLVSNVRYQNGDGSPKAMSYNTVGYFNKGKTDFPFEEGIVLSTNEIQYAAGPAQLSSFGFRGDNNERWVGDKDINDAINAAGGAPARSTNKRVTQVEFDFFSIKDSIKFEYLFASNSYHSDCTNVGCVAGALFAAWLVDSTTGEGVNLAKIKGTNTPIALNTIMDSEKTGKCTSANPELYWKHNVLGVDDPYEAYVDYVGLTKEMQSETVYVVPGRKYHIKLAVIDFCVTVAHSSAVFFNAGSFDLGNLDLGADMLVDNGSALCGGESRTIKSGLGTDEVTISWYKDEVLIPGANTPNLEVSETGKYKVVGRYDAINCEVMGELIVEIFPAISTVVNLPVPFEVCRHSLESMVIDLASVETTMFSNMDRGDYETSYYKDKMDAESGVNPMATVYELNSIGSNEIIYIRVDDRRTECSEVFDLPIKFIEGIIPVFREDVAICASYTLPELEQNQYYYTATAAGGKEYKAGDVLTEATTHSIYVLQRNNEKGCYEEISYNVTITENVTADVFKDETVTCSFYKLLPLSSYNKYFTESMGRGIELAPDSLILFTQTIYVYASSDDGLCTDESSFTITYEDCPIQKGISPNGDGLNDNFNLSEHGVTHLVVYNRYGTEVFVFNGAYTDQWHGQDKRNNPLPDGTYFYVITAHGKTRSGWVQINK